MHELADEIGPIDYLVIEFPSQESTGDGFGLLVDLVDRGIIRLLDLAVVRRGADGSITELEVADLDGDGRPDLTVFTGVRSGLLGHDELADAGALLPPGASAAVLVYENRWAAPLVSALRRDGASTIAGGRIPVGDVIAALDVVEASL